MSLLKYVHYDIVHNSILHIIRNLNNTEDNIYSHYKMYKKLLHKLDIPEPLYCYVSNNFKILFHRFLNDCYKKYSYFDIIQLHENVYYFGVKISRKEFKLYNPLIEEIELLKINNKIPYVPLSHEKDVNNGDTIFHDLIREKQYNTITELINTNNFDIKIKNYDGKTPCDSIENRDYKMRKIFSSI